MTERSIPSKCFLFLIVTWTTVTLAFSQNSFAPAIINKGKIKVKTISLLPDTLRECSGIVATSSNRIWCINDSGNSPQLFCIDTTGKIISTKKISNAENIDWEDITSDGKNFYIGDFGNNMNNRKVFSIYKFPSPDSVSEAVIKAQKMDYTYEDLQIPLPSHKLKFDTEAFVALNDTLFIFTKNRTRPFNGMLYIYSLPIDSNAKIATKTDSLFLGKGRMIDFWISSAALSPDKNHLALISYNKIWLFDLSKNHKLSQSIIYSYDFDFSSQKESISFYDNDKIYFTDERGLLFSKGALYYLNLNSDLNGLIRQKND
jgi:hypothetical protein